MSVIPGIVVGPRFLITFCRVFDTTVTDGRIGIKYEDLAYGTSQGFATVGSNNGHNGTTAIDMYHNPEVTKDFAWRA
jgi:hypothetical protein